MSQLISYLNIQETVKSFSNYVDSARVSNAIEEAQNLDLKPVLGEQLYIALIEVNGSYNEHLLRLMNGGIYTYGDLKYQFSGIKKALIYFAYARIIKSIDNTVSASGFLQKENDFSQHSSIKERIQASDDASSVGLAYLQECILFVKRNNEFYPQFTAGSVKRKSQFKALGD